MSITDNVTAFVSKPVRWLGVVLIAIAAGAMADAGSKSRPKGPRPPAPTGNYVAAYGDDWRAYADNAALHAVRQWWSWSRLPWQGHISLVPDDTFGQVVRMTQPKQDPKAPREVPRTFYLTQRFTEPLADVWVRFRVRFSPGFDLDGAVPRRANASYKLFFLTFHGADGRTGIEFANRRQYIYTNLQGGFQRDYEKSFGTHRWGGHVTGEFTNGQWYEYIVHREVTGTNVYVNRFYRRQLTRNGKVVDLPWNFWGIKTVGKPGQVARPAGGIDLGANKNKSNDKTQYVYWGPWEVVDGATYPNPFHVPLE